jgi:hypothetical protein
MDDTSRLIGIDNLRGGVGTSGQSHTHGFHRGFPCAREPRDPFRSIRIRPAIKESSLFRRERRGIEAARMKLDWLHVDSSAAGWSNRGECDGDSVGMRDRDGRERLRSWLCQVSEHRLSLFVENDRQIGWINHGKSSIDPQPAGRFLSRDAAPELL